MQTSLAARWARASGMTGEERIALLLAEPRIEDAMHRLSQNNLALAASDRAIDGIVKDVGRFFAAGLAITLHATGGLTLPRLKQYCVDSLVISPGRARALLLYMRFLKYVEPLPGPRRGGVYVPTTSMLHAWTAITRAGLEALETIEPEIARVTERIAEPTVLFAFTRIKTELARGGVQQNRDNDALWRVFLNRHAGTQILHALMLGAEGAAHYPPQGEIAFSLSKLARDFHVSRPHITRMLRAGEKEGLLVQHDNHLRFTAEGLTYLTNLLATRLGWDLEGALQLSAELTVTEALRKAG